MRNSRNLSFDDMDGYESKRNSFFALKDDGDKAIIRFYHDNGDDIEKLPVHTVTVGDRKVKVACLRMPGESEDNCPLCSDGSLVSPRMFIKVLVYEPDASGMYTKRPTLQIWERGNGFRKKMQSIINRYASNKPLMDTVFEIERCGKKGEQGTTYEIYPVNDFNADECPIPDDIEDFTALGTIVKDKSYEEMEEYLETGEFPKVDDKKQSNTRESRNTRKVEENEEETPVNEYPTGRRATGSRTVEDNAPVREMRRPARRI